MSNDIKILVVDDELNIINAMKRYFRQTPYQLFTAMNADEAIAILKEHTIAIIISDYFMPGKDGVGLLTAVKQHWPSVYRVLLTGNSTNQPVQEACEDGIVQVLVDKPWDNTEFHSIIDKARDILVQYKKGGDVCDPNLP